MKNVLKPLLTIISLATLLSSCNYTNKANLSGNYELIEIAAPSLANNRLGTKAMQEVGIYLPPSYSTSNKNYSVVYYLNGFTAEAGEYSPFGWLDSIVSNGYVNEVIFVELDGVNIFQGSMYANSPVSGNWEDFVTKDVISYVDANYRTIAKREGRGIAGHSMGGAGTVNISMKHADKYSVAYPMSPAISSYAGYLKELFPKPESIDVIVAFSKRIEAIAPENRNDSLKAIIDSNVNFGWLLGCGVAFAYDTTEILNMALPYKKLTNGNYELIPEVYNRWLNGFDNLDEKVMLYKDNLMSYTHYAMDCGYQDNITWLREAIHVYDSLLIANNIPHTTTWYTGDHVSGVSHQLANHVLPLMSTYLEKAN